MNQRSTYLDDFDADDPTRIVAAIAQRIEALEIIRDGSRLAQRILGVKSAIAVVGSIVGTRTLLNAYLGGHVLTPEACSSSIILDHGKRAYGRIALDDGEYFRADLCALEDYLRHLRVQGRELAALEVVVAGTRIPSDLCLVEVPLHFRRTIQLDVKTAFARRPFDAAIIVTGIEDRLGDKVLNMVAAGELPGRDVLVIVAGAPGPRVQRRVDAVWRCIGEATTDLDVVAVDIEALIRNTSSEGWTPLQTFLWRRSSTTRVRAVDAVYEAEMMRLVSRLRNYLHEHRDGLAAPPEIAERRAEHLVTCGRVIDECVGTELSVALSGTQALLTFLEQERSKFLMATRADLIASLATRIQTLPTLDREIVAAITHDVVEEAVLQWRARLTQQVLSATKAACSQLVQSVKRSLNAHTVGKAARLLAVPVVVLDPSGYRARKVALPPPRVWRRVLRRFLRRSTVLEDATRTASELATQLMALDTREVLQDQLMLFETALRALATELGKVTRELAEASRHGARIARIYDALGADARNAMIDLNDEWLDRVTAMERWLTPN